MSNMNFCDVVDVISGGTPNTKVSEYWGGDIPWLSVVDFSSKNKYVCKTEKHITQKGVDNSTTKVLNKNDIIISARGTVGAMAILDKPMAFNQSCFGLRAKPNILNQNYLFYFLRAYIGNISQKSQGSIFNTINLDTFKNIDINVPDMRIQEKTSRVLSDIDDKIENNNAICADLEAMAKLVYDYWFVQFDFPDENGRPYKSSGGDVVWNKELKREIPKGWELKKLAEIEPDIITGKTPPTEDENNYGNDVPFITIGDVRGNPFICSTAQKLSFKGADTQSSKYLPKDAICVTCIASPGLVGFTTQISQTNQQINSVVCSQEYNKRFLYFAIKQSFETTAGAKLGNAFANMSKGDLSSIKILYSKEVVQKYHETIANVFEEMSHLLAQNLQLASLRDFLLPMLMNGQVKVKE